MPITGSNKDHQQRSRIRRRLEEAGVGDEEAAARAAEAVGREDNVSARRSGAGSRQGDPAPREPSRRR